MPRGILPEVKLQAVKDYISGNGSYLSHASELGVGKTVFRRWVNHSENPLSSERVTINLIRPPLKKMLLKRI